MTKKLLTLLSLLVVSIFVLAACQPAATEAPADDTVVSEDMPIQDADATEMVVEEEPTEVMEATEVMAEPTESAAVEPIGTLRIWADNQRSQILVQLGDAFLAEYGIELIVEEVADIRDQFTIAAPAGEGPDITLMPHDQAGAMVASGLLAPIDLGDKAGLFVPSALASATYDGVLYGMPFATENMGFFYNTELVPTPPTTWDEVVAIGTQLMADGLVTYGMSVSGTTYDIYPLQTAFGGYVFGKDDLGNWNDQDLGIDSTGMIAAAQWLQDRVAEGFISDSTDWDTAHVLFETGETPFIMAGPWALDRFREAGVPYAIAPFPSATQAGYPFSGVQIFVVNAFSENVLLAEAFLTEFVATEDVMTQLYQANNRPSAFIPVLDATDDADLAALGLAGENAASMPTIPAMGSVWGSWNDAIVLALTGQEAPGEALATGAAQIRALIANPLTGMVNVPGSWQSAGGGFDCEWDPACTDTALTQGEDGLYTGTFAVVAGEYEVKVALDGGWGENYGIDGVRDGDNIAFSVTADGSVTFTYDPETHILTVTVE
jgi:maltose/maltodextrin transport system substrate-binding protein/arabinogalactan oligomer/maltooligosaccharide transport system substrate-binding protein